MNLHDTFVTQKSKIVNFFNGSFHARKLTIDTMNDLVNGIIVQSYRIYENQITAI